MFDYVKKVEWFKSKRTDNRMFQFEVESLEWRDQRV